MIRWIRSTAKPASFGWLALVLLAASPAQAGHGWTKTKKHDKHTTTIIVINTTQPAAIPHTASAPTTAMVPMMAAPAPTHFAMVPMMAAPQPAYAPVAMVPMMAAPQPSYAPAAMVPMMAAPQPSYAPAAVPYMAAPQMTPAQAPQAPSPQR